MPTLQKPSRIQHLFSGIGILLLALLLFVPMGYASWKQASASWKKRDCESWPKTTGLILDADIIHTMVKLKNQPQARHSYAVKFKYEYSVDGKTYSGSADAESYNSEWEAEAEFREKLKETGAEVTVCYSPEEPHINTLSPRNSSVLFTAGGFVFALFLGVFAGGGSIIIGIGCLFRAILPEK